MTTVQTLEDGRIRVRLGDLGLAPENLRFEEPADEGVPRLADTIDAAGMIYPPIVRKGRKGEQPKARSDMPIRAAIAGGRTPRSRRRPFKVGGASASRSGRSSGSRSTIGIDPVSLPLDVD